MIITPYKEKLIQQNFIEQSFGEDGSELSPNFEVFKKLNSTDQFYLAANFNWDDGIDVLNWIIDSPKCDKGTACLIFWKAEPDYYMGYNSETVSDSDREVFELLQKIILKFNNDEFKRGLLKFIPSRQGYAVENYKSEFGIWELPQKLKNGTNGVTPISVGGLMNWIWMYRRQRRLRKRELKTAKGKSVG